MLRNSILVRFLSSLIGCFFALCASAQPLIISDRGTGVYEAISTQVADQYRRASLSPLLYNLDDPHSKPSEKSIGAIDEVVTIGSNAMNALFEYKNLQVPSLSVLTTKENYLDMIASAPSSGSLRSAIYLNQPLERIVGIGGEILGEHAQYIIFDNKRFEQQRDIIDKKIITYAPIVDNTVVKTIRRLDTSRTKAIIALPSHAAFTPLTIKNTLISAYKAQIPIIGYSQSFTQAGALFSVHSNVEKLPEEIEAWRLKDHPPLQRASHYYTVSVNQQIARSLNIKLAPKWQRERVNLEGAP